MMADKRAMKDHRSKLSDSGESRDAVAIPSSIACNFKLLNKFEKTYGGPHIKHTSIQILLLQNPFAC